MNKELNDDLFFKREVILIYSRCIEVLALVTVKSEIPFQGLLERSCARSLKKDLKVNGFKMIEGFFVKEEQVSIGMGLEG